jgi:hypothetical protein
VGLGIGASAKPVRSRCAAVAALTLLLCAAAAVAASRSPNPTKAARACAAGKSITAHLGAADERYLAGFVRCMLRKERAQIGLDYRQTASLDRATRSALRKIDASSVGYGKASITLQHSLLDTLAMRACGRGHDWLWDGNIGDTNPPPPLTPIAIAKVNAHLFSEGNEVMGRSTATFGFAARHDLLFHGNDARGVSFAYIAVYCY